MVPGRRMKGDRNGVGWVGGGGGGGVVLEGRCEAGSDER